MVQGEILFEDYVSGWNADKPHLLASGYVGQLWELFAWKHRRAKKAGPVKVTEMQ